MVGINLSQSTQSKKELSDRRSLFDRSIVVVVVLFLVTLAAWGGTWWYTKTYDDKISQLESMIAQDTTKLSGKRADRVADFSNRLTLIGQNLDAAVDTSSILGELEQNMVPEVRLTMYEYNRNDRIVSISGVTSSFRYLAAQVISLKKDSSFSQVKVGDVSSDENGLIKFSVTADLIGDAVVVAK
jgi:hypothetical protein